MSDDLTPRQFPQVTWTQRDLRSPLEEIREWVEQEAVRSAEWYLRAKAPKANWSRSLRVVAIVLATAGAAIPFVNAVASDVDLQYGYLAFALAAGTVALDRFFGFSTAWMRYLRAEQRIHALLLRFRFRWANELAQLAGREPTLEEALELLGVLEKACLEVAQEVEAETALWAQEFHSNIAELRQLTAGQQTAPPQP